MRDALRRICQPVLWLWAAPASLLGLVYASATIPWHTRFQFRSGVIECYGPPIRWLLECLPVPAMALTLGHVVFGQTDTALDVCREHELVHVRQYERWGPLFLPLYFGYSIWLKLHGRNAYLENPFEREAFEHDRRRQLGEMDGGL